MSKITAAVVVTAAICLPLGALLRHDASAQVRPATGPAPVRVIEGHRHLARAQVALHEALNELDLSRQAGEAAWTDPSGRVAGTVDAVERATAAFDQMAGWVAEGMAQNNAGERHSRINALHPPAYLAP